MKPKPTIDLDAAGLEVQRLFAEDGTANAALKDMRGAREQRKEQLKKLLPPIWAAFEKGETVNGYSTRKEWCANFAKVSTRHCEHIIYGRKKDEANSVRSGFLSRIAAAKKKLADIQKNLNTFEEGKVQDSKALYNQIDPTITPVFEEFLALIAPDGYEVKPGDRGRWGVYQKWEEEEKPQPTPKKKKKKKKKKELRYSQKVHPGFIGMPGKPHKTHKMSNDGKRTWCGKTPGLTLAKDARMSDTPTCRGCQTGEQREQDRINYMKSAAEVNKKVKKLTAAQTVNALGLIAAKYKFPGWGGTDDETREWAERYLKFFEEQVKLHPEWRDQQIESHRKTIKGQIYNRAYAEPEVSEPAQALAAATAAADVPMNIAPEILDTVKRQKARIALGLHPTNDECPNEDDEDEEEFEDETEENSEEEVL
jgi:hypothetical protein